MRRKATVVNVFYKDGSVKSVSDDYLVIVKTLNADYFEDEREREAVEKRLLAKTRKKYGSQVESIGWGIVDWHSQFWDSRIPPNDLIDLRKEDH